MKHLLRISLLTLGIAFVLPLYAEEPPPVVEKLAEPDRSINEDLRRQIEHLKFLESKRARFRLIGQVTRGLKTPYAINGEDFAVADDAIITGKFKVGVFAEVIGTLVPGQDKTAAEIIVSSNSSPASIGSRGSSSNEKNPRNRDGKPDPGK